MFFKYMLSALASIHDIYKKIIRRFLMILYSSKFKHAGENLIFDPTTSYFTYKTISLGRGVFIGTGAYFSADKSFINIGSYVMFGPSVLISGGDHDHRQVGIPMALVKEKGEGVDAGVTIHDDVWIGANVLIMKGVTIGEGAIVAAGSVVTKSVEPNSIVAGVPAKKIRDRFDKEKLSLHLHEIKKYMR